MREIITDLYINIYIKQYINTLYLKYLNIVIKKRRINYKLQNLLREVVGHLKIRHKKN